jgi:outer membrane protein OmpA-like peptidoglycan-associated protein
MNLRVGVLALAALAYLFAGTGCANNKLQAQVDSLNAQNRELADRLSAEQQARQLAESRASAASGQLAALPMDSGTPGMGAGPLDLTTPSGTIGGRSTTPVITNKTAPSKPAAAARVALPGHVLFDSGKVTLNASATKTLDTMAATIKNKYSGEKLVIEGYTDSTPLSKNSVWTSNADLAQARATAVKNYLVKKGISASNISVKAMGPAKDANAAQARRVEVAVLTTK